MAIGRRGPKWWWIGLSTSQIDYVVIRWILNPATVSPQKEMKNPPTLINCNGNRELNIVLGFIAKYLVLGIIISCLYGYRAKSELSLLPARQWGFSYELSHLVSLYGLVVTRYATQWPYHTINKNKVKVMPHSKFWGIDTHHSLS